MGELRRGLHYPPPYIYGAQRFPLGGNTAEYTSYCDADPGNGDIPFYTNSVLIDFDGDISGGDKTKIGDIEISTECDCLEIEVGEIECPPQPGAPFDFTLTLTQPIRERRRISLARALPGCGAARRCRHAPARSVRIQAIPGGLADGATGTFNVQLPASHARDGLLYRHDPRPTLAECCSDKVCVDLAGLRLLPAA
ncbi:MAG: hypothetical protein R3F11_17870 [Verrucomicrobiales bacterium]